MKILNPDGTPVENPTIEQQIAALMAANDTLSNAIAKHADDLAALIANVTAHGERLAKLETVSHPPVDLTPAVKTIVAETLATLVPRNTVNGREI